MESAYREVEKLLADLKAVFPPGAKIVQGLEDGFTRLSQQIAPAASYQRELDRWEDITPTVLERRMLASLWESRNRGITRDALRSAMYFDKPEIDWPRFKLVDIKVCHLRKKMEEAGMKFWIETMWGTGYRLRQGEPPACRGKYLAGQNRSGPPT